MFLIVEFFLITFYGKIQLHLVIVYIGLIVEQGPENNNKYLRFNKKHHSRKSSLQKNLYDMFMRSTHTSDPEILEIIEQSLPKKTHTPMSPEVMNLLLTNVIDSDSDSTSDSDNLDSDDSDSEMDSN